MPKANQAPLIPLNGLFPIEKPSGPPSMRLIDSITPLLLDSKLFYDPQRIQPIEKKKRKKNLTHMGLKIGQGGTLDPLADGVLVLGVNRGTKHLQQFLECTKEYESWGLLGAATTTYDSEGPIISTHSSDGVTREDVEKVLDQFRGKINQTPPIFSALKMDGKPLYEYARESKPLPRAIPVRECQVTIDVIDFKPASVSEGDGGHDFKWPTEHLSEEEKGVFRKLTEMVHQAAESKEGVIAAASSSTETPDSSAAAPTPAHNPADPPMPDLSQPDVPEVSPQTRLRPAAFKVRMTVSSGTYVRSIVHDIGMALGCGAHVVTLCRTRQGQFVLHGDEEELERERKEAVEMWDREHPVKDITAAAQDASASKENGQSTERMEVEEDDEEAAMNGAAGPPAPVSTPAPAPATAQAEQSEEEASMNASFTSTPVPASAASSRPIPLPANPFARPEPRSSTACIPWSVWSNALAEREEMLTAEKHAYDAAVAENKLTASELKFQFSEESIKKRRRELPLKEWEEYVLARFVEVPVPVTGAHGHERRR